VQSTEFVITVIVSYRYWRRNWKPLSPSFWPPGVATGHVTQWS